MAFNMLVDLDTIKLAMSWVSAINLLWAGYLMAIGCLHWLAMCWLSSDYQWAISWVWGGYGLDMGWLLAIYWLAMGWLWVEYQLANG